MSGVCSALKNRRSWSRTVEQAVLWVSKESVILACQGLALALKGETRVHDVANEGYAIIQELVRHANQSYLELIRQYFLETERGLEDAIAALEANQDQFGPEGKYLSDSLRALSIFKRNEAFRSWTLEEVIDNPESLRLKVSQLSSQNRINPMDASILESLAIKLQLPELQNNQIVRSLDRRIEAFAATIPRSEVSIEELEKRKKSLLDTLKTFEDSMAFHNCSSIMMRS